MFKISKTTGKWSVSLRAAGLALALLLAFTLATIAWAHETVTVGDYTVEYGWVNEPAVAGQPNAVVINLAPTASSASQDANVDVSGLKVQAVLGDQSKYLTLQPLGENTPGQFIAPITPTRPGKYTIHLSGNIGTTQFDNDVMPEEVQTADVVEFPVASAPSTSNSTMGIAGWLGMAGIILGALGIVLGVIALARKPA
jgi:hypothetical protein